MPLPPDDAGLFDLERTGADAFRGFCIGGRRTQVFGGHLVAQSLRAAALAVGQTTVPHAVRTCFLGPGVTGTAIDYATRVLKEGRAFTVVEVHASQAERTLASATVSWHRAEASGIHQTSAPLVPEPDGLPELDLDTLGGPSPVYDTIDARMADRFEPTDDGSAPWVRLWKRWRGPLGDDPLVHACAVAWMSDSSMTRVGAQPDRDAGRPVVHASLDHTVRFHGPVRADRWLLFDEVSPVRSGGRALVRGSIYDRSGTLVVSTDQECLMRTPVGGQQPASG